MEGSRLSLEEASSRYFDNLPAGERANSQQAVYGFVRWYGLERPFAELTASDVASYAEQLSLTLANYAQSLELVKAFLAYGRKMGWSQTNLAVHLKPKKMKSKASPPPRQEVAPVFLTQPGYDKLAAELDELKGKRRLVIEEMRRAAADKDFRENAPLDAAREQRGHIEGRIREIEETLKSATIIEEKTEPSLKVDIGDSVVLEDMVSGEGLRYTIVSPREVDPSRGKISSSSPIGKALLGRAKGEMVEIAAPQCRLSYRIKGIER